MFAKYLYKPGTVLADFKADIIGMLTGTITDTSQLSASADSAACVLVNTTAAGWSVHDAAAGTDKFCVKAPNLSGETKYATLAFSTTNLALTAAEGWNASTHVATNDTTALNFSQGVNFTTGGIVYLYASPRTFQMSLGYNSTYSYVHGIIEAARETRAYDIAGNLPVHAVLNGWNFNPYIGAAGNLSMAHRLPRAKYGNNGVTANMAGLIIPVDGNGQWDFNSVNGTMNGARNASGLRTFTLYDYNSQPYYEILSEARLFSRQYSVSDNPSYNGLANGNYRIGRIQDFWMMHDNIGAIGDEFVTTNGTFVYAGNLADGTHIMLPKS